MLLEQNYPNPFSYETGIIFSLSQNGHVKLQLFNKSSKCIAILINKELQPGSYSYNFKSAGLASDYYYYRITIGNFVAVRKMSIEK